MIRSLKDSAALLRIINVPNRRLGKERIAMLVKDGETKDRTIWESIQGLISGEIRFASTDKAAETGLAQFVRCITVARRQLVEGELPTVSELIDYVRKGVKYDDHLRKKFGPDTDERIGNLEELKTFASELDRVTEENVLPDIGVADAQVEEETPLSRFLGNIALMTDVKNGVDEKADSVSLFLNFTDD